MITMHFLWFMAILWAASSVGAMLGIFIVSLLTVGKGE